MKKITDNFDKLNKSLLILKTKVNELTTKITNERLRILKLWKEKFLNDSWIITSVNQSNLSSTYYFLGERVIDCVICTKLKDKVLVRDEFFKILNATQKRKLVNEIKAKYPDLEVYTQSHFILW